MELPLALTGCKAPAPSSSNSGSCRDFFIYKSQRGSHHTQSSFSAVRQESCCVIAAERETVCLRLQQYQGWALVCRGDRAAHCGHGARSLRQVGEGSVRVPFWSSLPGVGRPRLCSLCQTCCPTLHQVLSANLGSSATYKMTSWGGGEVDRCVGWSMILRWVHAASGMVSHSTPCCRAIYIPSENDQWFFCRLLFAQVVRLLLFLYMFCQIVNAAECQLQISSDTHSHPA